MVVDLPPDADFSQDYLLHLDPRYHLVTTSNHPVDSPEVSTKSFFPNCVEYLLQSQVNLLEVLHFDSQQVWTCKLDSFFVWCPNGSEVDRSIETDGASTPAEPLRVPDASS